MKAAIAVLRSGKPHQPIPPGNLAYKCPSLLLSLDGSHELVPSGGAHVARNGVDGRPDTVAQGANEWPWTYEVYLVNAAPLRRIKVTFGAGYPTTLEVRVSEDRQTWTTVARREGHDGKPVEVTFEPIRARYIRVLSFKPDGPDQPGGQMSVAELEAYR